MEENKNKEVELSTKDFYKYLLALIDADMVKENLTSFKLRDLKKHKYFVSQTTYNNIKAVSKGESDTLLSNPNLNKICKKLKIKFKHKYIIIK
jgi:anaerobic ribonucleoside-triphosphate reductase